MAKTPSTMLPIGTRLPPFALPDTDGRSRTETELLGKSGLLVMFICNHCPFVVHVASELKRLGDDFPARGIQVVAISSNDVRSHPADSPEKMREEKRARGYAFPYLYDESQAVAKAYQAACTPDLFLFDAKGLLYYRGQMDGARPGNQVPSNGVDLRAAAEGMLAGRPSPAEQRPSMGCNIKWRPGNEPKYYP